MKFLSFLLAASLAVQAEARAVFAHFMIGNTEQYTTTDFLLDMRLAQAAHIDGFVLNIAHLEPANDRSIPMAFEAAASIGFKLLFSFDYAGNGDWPKETVIDMLRKYGSHPAHFRRDSQPLVSTFEGFKRSADWPSIKQETNCYFMPSWSSMGAKRAVRTGVTDGLFSWAAWPEGPKKIDLEVDASYLIFLNGSSYMMPMSPWFYTNVPGYNKNWLWRGDSLWHDRWNLAFTLVSQNQWPGEPEYLQIISWNDYAESHYIGPLNDKAYVAFDIGKAPYNYAKGYPHDAWRMLLPFAIDTYKNGIATITEEVLVAWYRLTPASACATGGTTGNTASQLQTEVAPGELSQDKIFFSAVLTGILLPRITINGVTEVLKWDDVPYGLVGMYHGSYEYKGRLGKVLIELIDTSGAVMAQLYGAELKNTCEKGITNWNPWVGGVYTTRSVNRAPALSLSQQECMAGTGREGYKELCEFSCAMGYCPPGPCTCLKLGKAELVLEPKNVDGYPLPGADCTYKGLCSHACNYGTCPSQYCTTAPSAKDKCVIPPEEPDPQDVGACTSGTGDGNLQGLCDFSCGRGYCPEPPCRCTGKGPVITPPKATTFAGYPAKGLGQEYAGLCNFVCSRGYCPEGACTYNKPSPGEGGWVIDTPPLDPGSDAYKTIKCDNPGVINAADPIDWRWDQIKAKDAWNSLRYRWTFKTEESVLSFPEWVSNHFNGPQNMECHKLVAANGCRQFLQCHDTNAPAGYFILNSFTHLSNILWNFYDSLSKAKTDLSNDAGNLISVFSPSAASDPLPIAIIIDIVTLGYVGLASPFWNSIMKNRPFFRANGNTHGTLKDAVNGAVAGSLTLVKDITKADSRITQANTLQGHLSAITDIWFDSTDEFSRKIFDGGLGNMDRLHGLIEDGRLLSEKDDVLSASEIKTLASRALNAMLIPVAWKISGRDLGPFILDGRIACDKYLPTITLSRSVQDKTRVCVDGNAYFLVGATEPRKNCYDEGDIGGYCDGFLALPGVDNLDGNAWGGVTKEDLVHGSVGTFKMNGNKNGVPTIDPVNEEFLSSVQDIDIRAPGIMNLPVCNAIPAERNYYNAYKGGNRPKNYPCDD